MRVYVFLSIYKYVVVCRVGLVCVCVCVLSRVKSRKKTENIKGHIPNPRSRSALRVSSASNCTELLSVGRRIQEFPQDQKTPFFSTQHEPPNRSSTYQQLPFDLLPSLLQAV